MNLLKADEMLVLFAILALGRWVGGWSIRRISLGTAGVFFVALVFGHFGFSVPKAAMDLGLLLFVYAVGLQAGPRFFRTFARQGRQFVAIAVATVGTGALVTVIVARLWHLPFDLAVGLYTGATTCTPALAAAVDAVGRIFPGQTATVSVGYGVGYPVGVVGVVLLIQLLPRLLHRNLREDEARWQAEQRSEQPELLVKQFRVTNPNCDTILLRDVNPHRMSRANISRVRHDDQVFAAAPDTVLHCGDIVMVVGPGEELEKMRLVLGEETSVPMDVNTNVMAADVDVMESSLVGKSLAELRVWERYSIVITRIRRQGLELTPTGPSTLEMGDNVRVVGEETAVAQFTQLIGGDPHKIDEVNMLPFLIGLVLGIALGDLPLTLSNGIVIRLGSAGGAFIVSLLVGHFGRIGPLRLYVPAAAKNLSRELGLMLFLAGAGTTAGSHLVEVIRQQGMGVFVAGAIITVVSVAVGLVLMVRYLRMNTLTMLGALSGCMTNSASLGVAAAQSQTDIPTLAYASVYPVALIFKILIVQILVSVLSTVRF